MRVIYNTTIPFRGYLAMCLWPWIFVRNELKGKYTPTVDNHEQIHARQQKEMLAVGIALVAVGLSAGLGLWAVLFVPLFFWWYGIEWLFRLGQYQDGHKAYRNISFEREAYANEGDLDYLRRRKHFAWLSYIFKNQKA